MQIDISLMAGYKVITGKGNFSLEVEEGATIREAFFAVLKRFPGLKGGWLDKTGKPGPAVHVFLNGDDISTLSDEFDTKLTEGDLLEFIPPLSGG